MVLFGTNYATTRCMAVVYRPVAGRSPAAKATEVTNRAADTLFRKKSYLCSEGTKATDNGHGALRPAQRSGGPAPANALSRQ